MGTPYLGEIRIISFNYAPKGWALCNGQLLPINQNQALFSLLGTTYGGDGRVTFALPNLQDRVAMHFGNGHTLGERAGEASHTLSQSEMPGHNHQVGAASGGGNSSTPGNNYWAASVDGDPMYISLAQANTTMSPNAISTAGGNQPHANMQPYLTVNFVIALVGIFPSRN